MLIPIKHYFIIVCLFGYTSADWSILHNPDVLCPVIGDIAHGLMTRHMTLVIDDRVADDMATKLTEVLSERAVTTTLYKLSSEEAMNSLESDIKKHMTSYENVVYVIIAREKLLEELMNMISEDNLVQRNILYLFLWNKFPPSIKFRRNIIEAMEVCVFVRNKAGNFNFYYNHKHSDGKSKLELVNWWSENDRLFEHPLLPPTEKVYQNFRGRVFRIPVVHKPPWYFVNYFNDTEIDSVSGRDKKLLDLLASKLNFRLDPFDPPDRSQGSAIVNNTMKGVLGTIWLREVEIFIGDLTVTYERSQAVDFTFPTLVDNEAFLTHAPGYLNEALALIRPFHWKVWPPVLLTICVSGPIMFIIIKMSLKSKENQNLVKRQSQTNNSQLLSDCIWVTSAIFLKQSCVLPSDLNKVRILVIVLYLGATYVIGDMYSANLTSMLARPARETPISTLEQLAVAMDKEGMQLLAELHSASHGNLENGTGLYEKIWKMMKRQHRYLIKTAEMGMQGMQLVKNNKRFALIGGRETFYYNTRRFGAHYFHLSEKLHTRYSAIALQIGCPFLHNFNKILMQLFEAGILAKITEDEYQKLAKEKKLEERKVETVAEGKQATDEEADGSQPRPMSMATLSGAFVVLSIGYSVSVLLLLMEIMCSKVNLPKAKFLKLKTKSHKKLKLNKLTNMNNCKSHNNTSPNSHSNMFYYH